MEISVAHITLLERMSGMSLVRSSMDVGNSPFTPVSMLNKIDEDQCFLT